MVVNDFIQLMNNIHKICESIIKLEIKKWLVKKFFK